MHGAGLRATGGAAGVVYRAIAALVCIAAPLAAAAQDVEQRAREIAEAMQGAAIYTDVFDEAFASQVSEEPLMEAILESPIGGLGRWPQFKAD